MFFFCLIGDRVSCSLFSHDAEETSRATVAFTLSISALLLLVLHDISFVSGVMSKFQWFFFFLLPSERKSFFPPNVVSFLMVTVFFTSFAFRVLADVLYGRSSILFSSETSTIISNGIVFRWVLPKHNSQRLDCIIHRSRIISYSLKKWFASFSKFVFSFKHGRWIWSKFVLHITQLQHTNLRNNKESMV